MLRRKAWRFKGCNVTVPGHQSTGSQMQRATTEAREAPPSLPSGGSRMGHSSADFCAWPPRNPPILPKTRPAFGEERTAGRSGMAGRQSRAHCWLAGYLKRGWFLCCSQERGNWNVQFQPRRLLPLQAARAVLANLGHLPSSEAQPRGDRTYG